MTLNDHSTLYDILDLKPDASPQEVREAYQRTKSAYNKDSVALYTLIGSDERDEMLDLIEQAYEVLSHTERRKEYDRSHGLLSMEAELTTHVRPSHNRKIISIDRVPPMDSNEDSEDLLVAPSTDFGATEAPLPFHTDAPATSSSSHSSSTNTATLPPTAPPAASHTAPHSASQRPQAQPLTARAESPVLQEIAQEIEWKGTFIRKIREARRISLEEMAANTKISKTYLTAIEEENFPKLPAAVFLRGFLIQVARLLKLPPDKVTTAYMARYYQARPEQVR